MADVKTKVNDGDVAGFLNGIEDEAKRADAFRLVEMFERVSGEPAKMWGAAIVGFGKYHYKSERSSQEADWMLTGFSPRKAALTLYLGLGHGNADALLEKLGKHKTGKGCLYINKLADVDTAVLEELIAVTLENTKKMNAEKGWS